MAIKYGSTPGIEVTVRGVAITGVVIGREQKITVFGHGDTNSGTASTNEPVEVSGRSDAANQFGTDSRLTNGLRQAISNGANASDGFLYGVAVDTTAVTAETVSGGSGTLSNAPIVEDETTITATDTTAAEELDVNYVYEDTPATAASGEVNVNPHDGEIQDDGTGNDIEFDYEYYEWGSALDAADSVLYEKESGIYAALSESESVASQLSSKVESLRDPEFKMVRGIVGAQPNATADGSETGLDDGDAKTDVSTYGDNLDNHALYVVTPTRTEHGSPQTLIGAVAGQFGGHELTNPVYKEELNGVEPLQRIKKVDRDTLRDDHQVIAIENEGSVQLYSNTSTSTDTAWEQDFHRVRIVDQVTLLAKEIADNTEGDLNNEDTQTAAEAEIIGQLDDLAAEGLLEPNTSDETNYYAEFIEVGSDELALDMGITPEGVVKTIKVTINVDA